MNCMTPSILLTLFQPQCLHIGTLFQFRGLPCWFSPPLSFHLRAFARACCWVASRYLLGPFPLSAICSSLWDLLFPFSIVVFFSTYHHLITHRFHLLGFCFFLLAAVGLCCGIYGLSLVAVCGLLLLRCKGY